MSSPAQHPMTRAAALQNFLLLTPDRQAAAVRKLLEQGWSVETVSRLCGLSADALVDLLREHPVRV